MSSSVHEPLLQNEDGDAYKGPRRLGPLEITRSTRYAILAGIWTATFLSSLNGKPMVYCFSMIAGA
ncbi:hypothetical protein PC9H_001724 [Pleurotus ostreatus]|uniref:Uncharacterized protein n=1 Tax=Pleurotus ostreatus TaxID=5322 RepID=A0A8H7A6M7_PLEOS|nr:uncharacterized protein PC9H_001724 [Pleurotus ostreatus]KAF7441374.1 hypothetical protein PC9H_001724 [Pleurotus ostreatus]